MPASLIRASFDFFFIILYKHGYNLLCVSAYAIEYFSEAQIRELAPDYFSYLEQFYYNCTQKLNGMLKREYIKLDEQQPIIERIDRLLNGFTESFKQNFYLT